MIKKIILFTSLLQYASGFQKQIFANKIFITGLLGISAVSYLHHKASLNKQWLKELQSQFKKCNNTYENKDSRFFSIGNFFIEKMIKEEKWYTVFLRFFNKEYQYSTLENRLSNMKKDLIVMHKILERLYLKGCISEFPIFKNFFNQKRDTHSFLLKSLSSFLLKKTYTLPEDCLKDLFHFHDVCFMYVTELTAQRDSIRSFSGHDYDIYNTKEDICKSEYKNCHITIFFKEPGKCNETIYRTNNTIYTSEFPFLKTILALIIDRYDKPSEEIFSYFKKNKNLAAIINNEDFDKKSFLDGIVYLAQHFEKYIEEKISLNKPFAISNPLFRDFLAYLDPIANENIPEEISKILANYLYKKFLTKNSASEENDIYSMFKDLLAYNEKTEYNPQEGPFYLIYFLGLCKNKIIKPAKNRFFSEEYKRAIFDSQGLLEYCPDLDDKEKEEAANRAIGQNIRRQQNQINIQNQNNFNIYHSILYSQSIVTRYYFR